jgi:hypothetical protein
MLSKDPDDQFKAEYFQLENRYIMYSEMLMEWDLGRLDPAPKGDRYAYGNMVSHMREYLQFMKRIAAARGIDLSGKNEAEESEDDDRPDTE